jgi:hypothetical protein
VAERDRLLSDCRALNSTESSNLSLPARIDLFIFFELQISSLFYKVVRHDLAVCTVRDPAILKDRNAVFLFSFA